MSWKVSTFATELNRRLQEHPEYLNGIVDAYPALNPMGVDTLQRGVPFFDLDMNRIFPGNANGAVEEWVASELIKEFSTSDFAIDIHASNLFLREIPQVRVNINSAEDLVEYAEMLDVDFVWIHQASTVLESTLAYSLNSIGVKTLVVEAGVGMRITVGYCERLVNGILNLLKMKECGPALWIRSVSRSFLLTAPYPSLMRRLPAFLFLRHVIVLRWSQAKLSVAFLTRLKGRLKKSASPL